MAPFHRLIKIFFRQKKVIILNIWKMQPFFKFKADENFTGPPGGARIALKVSADASLRVTKVPKFKPDADIGQISADFERGRFEIASLCRLFHSDSYILSVTAILLAVPLLRKPISNLDT